MQNWSTTKLAGHCGACLTGGSLADLDAQSVDAVKDALFSHGVVCVPDQHLTPEAHTALAEAMARVAVDNTVFEPGLTVYQYVKIEQRQINDWIWEMFPCPTVRCV